MKLVKASEQDSERLKAFFESVLLPGSIDFSIRRHGSFFDHYRLLSNDFETHMLIDDHGEIAGVGSLVFNQGTVLGEDHVWGYATDLRIRPSRKAVLQWAQHFLPTLERAREERNCKYVLSAIELHDNQATNALIRPTNFGRRSLPRYHLANRFNLVAIHGRVPLSRKPLGSIRLKPLEVKYLESFCDYLNARGKHRPLFRKIIPESFLNRLNTWPGLSISDFRIATDADGRILGTAALWNSARVQSWIPKNYNGFAQTAHQTLHLASWLRLVRPTPPVDQAMKMQFLTHLTCDSPEVFHRLTDDAYDRLAPKELLIYMHFQGHWRTLPPHSYIATAIPFGLYLVLPPNTDAPSWPTPHMTTMPPEFDPAWI